MNVKLIQTADPVRCKPMLEITAPATRRFCEVQGAEYAQFIGIKRGCHPWHAAFNRIPMLCDLVREGFDGWVIYLDAVAYPFDIRFDLAGYLSENRQWGVIAAAGGTERYMPNSGIMLLNMALPATREVIAAWQGRFDTQMPNERLREAPDWIGDGDQTLLHEVLYARGDADLVVKVESFHLIGWPESVFLRQMLRQFGTFDERCSALRRGVAEALNESPAAARLMASFKGR